MITISEDRKKDVRKLSSSEKEKLVFIMLFDILRIKPHQRICIGQTDLQTLVETTSLRSVQLTLKLNRVLTSQVPRAELQNTLLLMR